MTDQLGPARREEKELGLGGHFVALHGMLQEMSDAFADRRAPRLTNQDRGDSGGGKGVDEQIDLRGLAAALGPLESDEETCLTRVGHARIMNLEQDFRKAGNVFRRN